MQMSHRTFWGLESFCPDSNGILDMEEPQEKIVPTSRETSKGRSACPILCIVPVFRSWRFLGLDIKTGEVTHAKHLVRAPTTKHVTERDTMNGIMILLSGQGFDLGNVRILVLRPWPISSDFVGKSVRIRDRTSCAMNSPCHERQRRPVSSDS